MMEEPAPLVSVVMPTYNQARFLRDAIRSVLLQDDPRLELLVINNFSEDDTREVMGSFADPRIRGEDFRNHGIIAASRNRGIQLSRGQFVAFLDSDDLWYPAKLSTCLKAMGEGTDAVCHGMRINEDGVPDGCLVPSPLEGDLYRTLLLQGNSLIATSSVVIRKDCLTRAGGFCEDREIVSSEDYELWLRLAREGTRFLPLKDVLGEYRVHGKSASRSIPRQSDAEAEVVRREFMRVSDGSLAMALRRKRRMALVRLQASRRSQLAGKYGEAALSLFRALGELAR
jgi:glycosyltransferase involved in cell wall biosynthesis